MSSIQPFRGDDLRPSFRNASVADVMTPGGVVLDGDRPVGVLSTRDVAGAAAWGRQ